MKKGSPLRVRSSARRHLMTSEPVRDPLADHLLTARNCALIIIDYQPADVMRMTPAGGAAAAHPLGGAPP
jgi:hypothetical protein